MHTLQAIRDRASIRAFLDRDVSKSTVEEILRTARWAPSGTNTQPWQVAVAGREVMARISEKIVAALDRGDERNPDYQYYPHKFVEPYRSRRVTCGKALYEALDIQRDDKEGRKAQWYKNYDGFGAPVVIFVLIDATLEKGSWVDCGMFLQNVMLAAHGLGLGTCPQAALAEFPDIVRKEMGLANDLHLVCGIALGYPDSDAPENQYRTEREEVDAFTTWRL